MQDALLACLEKLCSLHNRPRSAVSLTAGLPLVDNRLTPELFIRAAERSDLSARLQTAHLAAIKPEQLPAVLLNRDGGAVLLLGMEQDAGCKCWLPGKPAEQTCRLEELASDYSGSFIEVRSALKLDDRAGHHKASLPTMTWFWGTLLRYRRIYLNVILATLITNLFVVASPLFVMNVYDRVVPNRAYETLGVLAIGVVIVFGFELLLRVLRGYFIDIAGKRADNVMSAILYERVMGLRMEYRPASSGAMASQLKEFESLRDFFTSATLVSIVDLPFLFIFIFIIWMIGGPLFWVPLLAAPIIVGIGLAFQPALSRAININLAEANQKHGHLVESLSGMETLKSLSAQGTFQRKWEDLVEASSVSGLRSRYLSSLIVNLTNVVQQLVYVAVVVAGVFLITDNLLSVGGLIACSILAGRAMAPLGQVSALFVRYQSARQALEGLNKLILCEQERPVERRYLHRPQLSGDITVDKVSFQYPGHPVLVLNELSFRIAAGDKVAILGRIGSGKSTLLRLLLGLYRPSGGTICFDGIDQNQIDPVDLRANIGYVEQDSRLFYGTLRENITLARPEAGDEEVLAAARVAGVEDFVKRHPLGYELKVGEGGLGLSGGQRQAVALARALMGNPPILLMDEPTSGMDQAAEIKLIQNLKGYLAGKTLVLVTHKPSMMALVDKIILVDQGQVVAAGDKDQILRKLAQNDRTT